MTAFQTIATSIVREAMLDRPKSPEMTAGEASGYSVALALLAVAQFGSLSEWSELAAIVTAGLVAGVTVWVTKGIREVRNTTEQVRLGVLADAAVGVDEYDPEYADLDELDTPE